MSKFRSWKTLPAEHKDYVFVYVAAILWCVAYFVFLPTVSATFIDRSFFIIWILPVVLGGGFAINGLLTRDNLLTERLGVTLVMLGPIMYGLLQIGVTISFFVTHVEGVDLTARIPLVFLSLWLFLFLNKRRRQLKRKVAEAKDAPLPAEAQE